MDADLIKNIQNNFNSFSKSQKLIAEFLISSYDKAAFMTAATIGSTVGVSESTVVRFANFLGYEGYKDLQNALQELIKNKLTTVQRLTISSSYSNEKSAMKKVMELDKKNLDRTINEIDNDSFHRSLELILKSRKTYIIGLRSSSYLAGYFGFYLNFLQVSNKVVTSGAQDVFEQLVAAGPEDVIVAISYPRYSKRTIEALEFAKSKGCKIVAITDSLLSPASKFSDIILLAGSEMSSIVDSLVAPMSLINALIVNLSIAKKDQLTNKLEELEVAWKKYNVYDVNGQKTLE